MRPEYMGKNGFMTNHHRERMGVVALANPGLISVGWRLTLQYQRWGRWWLVATGQSFHACWPKFYGFLCEFRLLYIIHPFSGAQLVPWSLLLRLQLFKITSNSHFGNISSPSFIVFSFFFLCFPIFSLQPPALPLLLWSPDHKSQDPGGFPGVCGLSGHRWGGSCSGFGRRHGLGLGMSSFCSLNHPRYPRSMAMDQYLLIPFLVGWTSIYQLFWCSPGVQGFDTLPYPRSMGIHVFFFNWSHI